MRFMVTRLSVLDTSKRPCPRACRETYVRVDRRGALRPNEISAYRGKDESWWYAEGRNHRSERGTIARDFDAEGWFIEIGSLQELIAFQDKHGDLVLTKSLHNPDIRAIEIYDDYRE